MPKTVKYKKRRGRPPLKRIGGGRTMYPLRRGAYGGGGTPYYITRDAPAPAPTPAPDKLADVFIEYMKTTAATGNSTSAAIRAWAPTILAGAQLVAPKWTAETAADQAQTKKTAKAKAKASAAPETEAHKTEAHRAKEKAKTDRLQTTLEEEARRENIKTGHKIHEFKKGVEDMAGIAKDAAGVKDREGPQLRGSFTPNLPYWDDGDTLTMPYKDMSRNPAFNVRSAPQQVDPAHLERLGSAYRTGRDYFWPGLIGLAGLAAGRQSVGAPTI